jgi:hypothetical protein
MTIPKTQFRNMPDAEDLQSHVVPVYQDWGKRPASLGQASDTCQIPTSWENRPVLGSAAVLPTKRLAPVLQTQNIAEFPQQPAASVALSEHLCPTITVGLYSPRMVVCRAGMMKVARIIHLRTSPYFFLCCPLLVQPFSSRLIINGSA